MKTAFPTQTANDLDSPVFNHFGSAAFFIVVDTDTHEYDIIENQDKDHLHGQCQPLAALDNYPVDAVVVGGIGKGALGKLNASGVRTFRAVDGTVRENLSLLAQGKLQEFLPGQTCKGHGPGGGCAH